MGNPQFLGHYKGEHYLQNNNKNFTIINLQNVFDLQHSIHSHLGFTPTDTEFKLKKTHKDKKRCKQYFHLTEKEQICWEKKTFSM